MGAGPSSARQIFDRLSRNHSGTINLDEMASMASQTTPDMDPGMAIILSIANSPLVLFHFDVNHEGTINYEEFEELRRNIQEIQRQVRERRRAQRPSLLARLCCSSCCAAEPPPQPASARGQRQPIRAFTTFNKSTREALNMDRTSTTPVFTSMRQGGSHLSLAAAAAAADVAGADSELPAGVSAVPDMSNEDGEQGGSAPRGIEISEDADITAEVICKLVEDARGHFLSKLKNKEGREAYKQWLFRLTDIDRRGLITFDELRLILRAIERDGIRAQRLCFDMFAVAQLDRTTTARTVMEEYAHGRPTMTREQFMVLAEVILQEYEFMQRFALSSHTVGKYRLTRLLGTGSSGAVMYAYDLKTGDPHAVKVVRRGRIRDMSRLDVEIRAMGMLQHPNVVTLEEVLQTDDHVFLVMENCGGGCLFDCLPEDRVLTEAETRHFFQQIMLALRYCHGKGVSHRDLRLENLLLDNNGTLKVSDFGHAGIFQPDWDVFSTSLVGSLYYMSPEQVCNRAYSGQRLDMWAAGVTLYRLLVGQMPFHSSNMQDFFAQVGSGRYEAPTGLSSAACDLIARLLSVDPDQRPLPDEVLAHPWMNGDAVMPPLLSMWACVQVTQPASATDVWEVVADCLADQGMAVNERPADGPQSPSLATRTETLPVAQLSLEQAAASRALLDDLADAAQPTGLQRAPSTMSALLYAGSEDGGDVHQMPSRSASLISFGSAPMFPIARHRHRRQGSNTSGVAAGAAATGPGARQGFLSAHPTVQQAAAAPGAVVSGDSASAVGQSGRVIIQRASLATSASTLSLASLDRSDVLHTLPLSPVQQALHGRPGALSVQRVPQQSQQQQPPPPPTQQQQQQQQPEPHPQQQEPDRPAAPAAGPRRISVPSLPVGVAGAGGPAATDSGSGDAGAAAVADTPRMSGDPERRGPFSRPFILADGVPSEPPASPPHRAATSEFSGQPLSLSGMASVVQSGQSSPRRPGSGTAGGAAGGSAAGSGGGSGSMPMVVDPDVPPQLASGVLNVPPAAGASAPCIALTESEIILEDVRAAVPVVRVAQCSDATHGMRFVVRLRAHEDENVQQVWLELSHVSGEVWRFRRAGRRLQTRLGTSLRELRTALGLEEPAEPRLRSALVRDQQTSPNRPPSRISAADEPGSQSRPPAVGSLSVRPVSDAGRGRPPSSGPAGAGPYTPLPADTPQPVSAGPAQPARLSAPPTPDGRSAPSQQHHHLRSSESAVELVVSPAPAPVTVRPVTTPVPVSAVRR